MIAGLRGTVQHVGLDHAIIEAGPFALKVALPLTTLQRLPPPGETVRLYTHFYVKDDVLALYGFATEEDLALFEKVLTVQGVGPRIGLGLLSALPAAELRSKIAAGDEAALTRVPGVGKRTAARLILELKERMAAQGGVATTAAAAVDAELVDALIGWGYKRPDAERVLRLPEIAAVPDPGARLAAAAARLVQRET
jgi:Holliday junction DNA helicase RuvA